MIDLVRDDGIAAPPRRSVAIFCLSSLADCPVETPITCLVVVLLL